MWGPPTYTAVAPVVGPNRGGEIMTSEPELRKFSEAEPLRLGVVSDYI